MTSVQEQGWLAQRGQASKIPTNRFNNRDHKDPLGSNKPEPSKALEAPVEPPKVLFPVFPTPNIARYTQKDIDHLLQMFFQVSKYRSGDKLQTKTPDVYQCKSHMECYNFCQQCEDYFITCEAIRPNQIPFAASFLQDHINFRW